MNSGMLLRVGRHCDGLADTAWTSGWTSPIDTFATCWQSRSMAPGWRESSGCNMKSPIMSGEGTTSMERYENLMGAQDAYFSQYKSFLRNAVFCQRLLRIALRERKVRPERSRLLFTHLVRRFTVPKRRRLEESRCAVSARRRADLGRTPGSAPS